jgi:hypothetical protein
VIYEERTGKVLGWVVTACELDFNPVFQPARPIELWNSTIKEAKKASAFIFSPRVTYFRGMGGTGFTAFGREDNTTGLLVVAFGWVPVCGKGASIGSNHEFLEAVPTGMLYSGRMSRCVPDLAKQNRTELPYTEIPDARKTCSAIQRTPVNLYGEYYLIYEDEPESLICHFQLGTPPSVIRGGAEAHLDTCSQHRQGQGADSAR